MNLKPKSTRRRLAVTAASVAVAATALLTGAGEASATNTTVSSWGTWESPVRCIDSSGASVVMCLYYNSNAGGAIDKKYDTVQDGTISDTFWATDQYGSAGNGQNVRNNAASVENASYGTIGVWTSPWFYGDSDYIPGGRGGNLTWNVKNNEASWGFLSSLNRGGTLVLA